MKELDEYYRRPDKKFWQGRISSKESPDEYWHEQIILNPVDINSIEANSDIGLLGYACDEGVRRNNGRVGAVDGPNTIREQLAKLSWHSKKNVSDYGDVICHQNNMEISQNVFSDIVKKIIESGQLSIGMGGGHDLAYGHFCGIHKALKNKMKSKIGILNFDAHFDLRPPLKNTNSGTPFYQIIKEFKSNVEYLVIGLQKPSNPLSLYKIASELNVDYIPIEDCNTLNLDKTYKILDAFFEKCETIYISVDLDGFTSSQAPGVSAPGPFGFSIVLFKIIFEYILTTKKVIAIDIVELNPAHDINSITAKLASQIIDFAVTKY